MLLLLIPSCAPDASERNEDVFKKHIVILGFNETGLEVAEHFREKKREVRAMFVGRARAGVKEEGGQAEWQQGI